MNINNIIRESLENYDININKYKDILDKIKNEKIKEKYIINENKRNIIYFEDEKGNKILESSYEILGLYVANTWIWAWAFNTSKKNSFISRKLLYYGLDLDPTDKLKSLLINSRYKLNNKIQLDIHIALASYLTKINIIFPLVEKDKNRIVYFLLFDLK